MGHAEFALTVHAQEQFATAQRQVLTRPCHQQALQRGCPPNNRFQWDAQLHAEPQALMYLRDARVNFASIAISVKSVTLLLLRRGPASLG